ncbi:MAG: hypothetical protein SF123_05210 [Chloroflexota bacterium]|nr:hypothetical protein [Chloroflexota bacterium]
MPYITSTKWFVSVTLIILLAALVRVLTFERFLPFADYPDELNMYMLALDWRNAPLGEAYGAFRVGEWLGSYPPLFVWIAMGVQSLLENAVGGRWLAAGEIIYWLRLLSVGYGVLTAALIASSARLLAGWRAGVIAGLVWALAAPVIEYNSLAIPDPLVYLTCAAAVWGAARAFRQQSFAWAVAGVVAAISAIYTKYVPVYALLPPLLAMAWLTWRRKRGALIWWSGVALVGVASAAFLITMVSNQPLSNSEANAARGMGASRLLDTSRNWNNLQTMVAPIGIFAIGLAGAGYLWAKRKRPVQMDPLLVALIVYLLPVVPLASLVNDTGGRAGPEIRHVMPGVIALILLWSGVVAHLMRTTQRWLKWIGIAALLVWLIPTLFNVWQLVERFQTPHIIYQLWRWSDASLPDDGTVLIPRDSAIVAAWNRPWSGYDGQNDFQWWIEDPQPEMTAQALADRGMRYFAFTDGDRQRLQSPTFDTLLAQMLLLKTLHPAAPTAGSTIYVYRVLPPRQMSNVVLGEQIQLVGYDLSTDIANTPTLMLRLYWRAPRQPLTNYSLFVHVVDTAMETIVAQYDGAPAAVNRLTLQWDDPDEVLLSNRISLTLPETAIVGSYSVRLGLYDFVTGERLRTSDGEDSVELLLR